MNPMLAFVVGNDVLGTTMGTPKKVVNIVAFYV
jgi:hypothetical protein